MQQVSGLLFTQGEKDLYSWDKKAFFLWKQRPFFCGTKKFISRAENLEFSGKNGKKRYTVPFLSGPFFDLSYKKKRQFKIFLLEYFFRFCI